MKLVDVIEALVEEKGLDKAILTDIVCEGLLGAYQKRYPELPLRAVSCRTSGELTVEIAKQVVQAPSDEALEISVRKAKNIDPSLSIGDSVWLPFDGAIGRIEILRARQIIAGKIREIEAAAVYDEFHEKEGMILQGTVHKNERSGVSVKIQDHLAFLPKSLSIPGEKCPAGFPIRVLLKEVLKQPRNENQLILDRASSEFLQKLFELEIPEVFERLVDVKKIVRNPGYKSKVAVISNDPNVDPVGTCVGVGGVRIKPILKELGSEKIDIVEWTDNLEVFVRHALKPAEINRVELADDSASARVWLDDDQRSLAIGKMGQNISLASRLTGVNIELVQTEKRENLDQKLSETF